MIFTKKEELRPVSYMGWGTHQGELFEGWFHGWVQETEGDGVTRTVALVELPSGEMKMPYAARVIFNDR
jgi:hypothetical protein